MVGRLRVGENIGRGLAGFGAGIGTGAAALGSYLAGEQKRRAAEDFAREQDDNEDDKWWEREHERQRLAKEERKRAEEERKKDIRREQDQKEVDAVDKEVAREDQQQHEMDLYGLKNRSTKGKYKSPGDMHAQTEGAALSRYTEQLAKIPVDDPDLNAMKERTKLRSTEEAFRRTMEYQHQTGAWADEEVDQYYRYMKQRYGFTDGAFEQARGGIVAGPNKDPSPPPGFTAAERAERGEDPEADASERAANEETTPELETTPPITTPVDAKGNPDVASLEKSEQFQLADGMVGKVYAEEGASGAVGAIEEGYRAGRIDRAAARHMLAKVRARVKQQADASAAEATSFATRMMGRPREMAPGALQKAQAAGAQRDMAAAQRDLAIIDASERRLLSGDARAPARSTPRFDMVEDALSEPSPGGVPPMLARPPSPQMGMQQGFPPAPQPMTSPGRTGGPQSLLSSLPMGLPAAIQKARLGGGGMTPGSQPQAPGAALGMAPPTPPLPQGEMSEQSTNEILSRLPTAPSLESMTSGLRKFTGASKRTFVETATKRMDEAIKERRRKAEEYKSARDPEERAVAASFKKAAERDESLKADLEKAAEVWDGQGIPAEQQQHMWEIYRKLAINGVPARGLTRTKGESLALKSKSPENSAGVNSKHIEARALDLSPKAGATREEATDYASDALSDPLIAAFAKGVNVHKNADGAGFHAHVEFHDFEWAKKNRDVVDAAMSLSEAISDARSSGSDDVAIVEDRVHDAAQRFRKERTPESKKKMMAEIAAGKARLDRILETMGR